MLASTRLTRKLLAGLALGLILASLVFLALFIETYRAQLSQERANASEQVTHLLQVSLENAMLKRDLPGLSEIVERLGQQPGIASVRIINPSREVRFASAPEHRGTSLSFEDLGCPACGAAVDLPGSTSLMTDGKGREFLRSVAPIHNKPPCAACHGAAADHPVNGILVVDHDGHDSLGLLLSGIGYQASQECDALDQFGDALRRQQCQSDRDQQACRPTNQAAGVRRRLTAGPGVHERWPRQLHHEQHQRQQEEQRAEDIDPRRGPAREAAGDDVDPYVLVVQQRVPRAQQKDGGEEIPLQFQPRVRTGRQRVADERVA